MANNNFNVGFVFGAKKATTFDKAFGSVNKAIGGVIKNLTGLATAAVSAKALLQTGKAAIQSASDLEGYRNTLNVVMKDSGKAAEAMKWAVDFANRTPFETDSIVEATVRLESYGIKAKSVLPQIGDMAGVMNKDIMQAVEAVADAQTGELERMKEFGITKAMIAEKAGKMFVKAETINSKGQIVNQENFNTAMFALMEDKFKGGMDIQSKSFKGTISTVKGVWKTGLASMVGMSTSGEVIAGSAFDLLKGGITSAAKAMQDFSSNGGFEKIGKSIGGVIKTVTPVFSYIGEKGRLAFDSIKSKIVELQPKFDAIKDVGIKIGDTIKAGFENAQPAIDWIIVTGLPAVVGFLTDVALKAGDVAGFFTNNWSWIEPIIWGIVGAFTAYKAIIMAITAKQWLCDIATKAMAVGQGILNAVMAMNPISLIIIAVVGLTAGFIALWNNCEGFRNFFIGMWDGIKTAFAAVGTWFASIGENIKNTFSGIGEFIGKVWDGVIAGFKGYVNFIISGINFMIGAINKLQVTVPDWVPLFGGKTIGFAIPEIPMLAQGGIATAPTLAMVGEGKEKEAILPLSKLDNMLKTNNVVQTFDFTPLVALLAKFLQQGLATAPNIVYSPNIIVEGDAKADDIKVVLDQDFERFKTHMEQYQKDIKRRKF